MVNYKFKTVDYYLSIKGDAMKDTEEAWCKLGYRNPDKIGYNMYLISKYKPSSAEDFFNQYINDFTTIDDPLHGRNLGMLETLAISFKNDIEKNNSISHTVEYYLDIIILHTIIETWEGYRAEEEIRKLLISKGNTIVDCDDVFWKIYTEKEQQGQCFDAWSSIDIVSSSKDKITRLIQIKPITTFISTHPKTIKDRLNFDKHNIDGIEFIKKYMPYKVSAHIYVTYMIYHKNNDGSLSWYYWLNSKNKKRFDFTLKKLLDKNFVEDLYRKNNFEKII